VTEQPADRLKSDKRDTKNFPELGKAFFRPLPSSKDSFPDIIAKAAVYIDKTKLIHELLTDTSANSVLLSRPRRFGKTILVSTIEAILQGRKDLFKGCDITKPDCGFKWKKSHVINLDMSICGDIYDNIEERLTFALSDISNFYGIDIQSMPSYIAIEKLITTLYDSYRDFPLISNHKEIKIRGKAVHADCPEVAILIDEFDLPLVTNLTDHTKLKFVQETLSKFYNTLKRLNKSQLLRFIFVTGITRFKELLWKSGMNAIEDISFSSQYSNICGFTTDEIKQSFNHHICDALKIIQNDPMTKPGYSIDDLYSELEEWYGGYSWDGKSRVINPHSTIQFMRKKHFAKYWYATGSSNFLSQLNIHNPDYFKLYAKNLTCDEIIDGENIGSISPTTALLMTGYLTVKKIIFRGAPNKENQFVLGIPNLEVMTAFAKEHLLDSMFKQDSILLTNEIIYRYKDFTQFLSDLELENAGNTLSSLLAIIPVQHLRSDESFYQKEIGTAFMFFNGKVIPEHSVGGGNPDFVLYHNNDNIFAVEIKYSKTMKYLNKIKPTTESEDTGIVTRTGSATSTIHDDSSYPDHPPVTHPVSAHPKLAKTDKSSKIEQERIHRLLDKGVKDAFDQLFGKGYVTGFLSPRYKVYAIAISIVNRSEVLIDCREASYGDWRNDPRPTPLSPSNS
jgi:hypothetical protein